jgi:8-oxo-dGTP diphosphatase
MKEKFREFGEILPGVTYVPRPGGYAIIHRAGGDIAVVTNSRGHYLPGGGQEPGEAPADAAVREAREECGLSIHIVEEIGVADQFVYSGEEAAGWQKRCTFFVAEVAGEGTGQEEADHVLSWVRPVEAMGCLVHESQRWAVRKDVGEAFRREGASDW